MDSYIAIHTLSTLGEVMPPLWVMSRLGEDVVRTTDLPALEPSVGFAVHI